jgi:hypothetical protein
MLMGTSQILNQVCGRRMHLEITFYTLQLVFLILGIPYKFSISAYTDEGKPINDTNNPVNVTVYYGWNDKIKSLNQYYFKKNGKIEVSITAPLSAELLDFEVSHKQTLMCSSSWIFFFFFL